MWRSMRAWLSGKCDLRRLAFRHLGLQEMASVRWARKRVPQGHQCQLGFLIRMGLGWDVVGLDMGQGEANTPNAGRNQSELFGCRFAVLDSPHHH